MAGSCRHRTIDEIYEDNGDGTLSIGERFCHDCGKNLIYDPRFSDRNAKKIPNRPKKQSTIEDIWDRLEAEEEAEPAPVLPRARGALEPYLTPEAAFIHIAQWRRWVSEADPAPAKRDSLIRLQLSYAYLTGDKRGLPCFDCGHSWEWHVETRDFFCGGYAGPCDCRGWNPDYEREQAPQIPAEAAVRSRKVPKTETPAPAPAKRRLIELED